MGHKEYYILLFQKQMQKRNALCEFSVIYERPNEDMKNGKKESNNQRFLSLILQNAGLTLHLTLSTRLS